MIRDLNANDFLYILAAARWTIALSLIAIVSGGCLGLVVMLARLSRSRIMRSVFMAYIQFFQATPLLMQLFLVFFGGTLVGIRFDAWTAALIAFSLHSSAFLGDIWHGCVLSVPRTQWEGARALALPNWVTLRLVIAPQAGRLAVAPTIGFLVQLIKGTSLASIIGFTELVRAGQFITNATLQPLFVYGFVACLFYMICWPLSKLSQAVEIRLSRGFQREETMLRKLIGTCALTLALAAGMGAAAAQTVDDIVKKGELVVGIDLTNAPWGFLDAQQEPAGFDPAFAKLVADKMGVKLRIERVTGPTRIPYLQSGRADVIISTLSVTAERAKQVWFTAPYAPNPLILIAPKDKNYKQYSDLKGARIAVPRGSPQDLTVTKMAPDAVIMRFDDDASVQQALMTGQADLLGGGILVPGTLNKMKPGQNYESKIVLNELYMSMAVKKGASDLLHYLNTLIFLVKQSGELDQLTQQHLGVPAGILPVF